MTMALIGRNPGNGVRRPRGIMASDFDDYDKHMGRQNLYTEMVDLLHYIAKDEVIQHSDKIIGLVRLRNIADELINVLEGEDDG
jgi:hypothetical protein